MATVATFAIAADRFPLGSVFETFPGVTVELERVVPTNHAVIPYFWVRGVATDDIEAAFHAHPGIRAVSLVDSVREEYLLRTEWNPAYEGVMRALAETSVSTLSARGTADSWTFELRADDRRAVSAFQARCREQRVPIELVSLHELTERRDGAGSGLTDAQRSALRLAHRRGYCDPPRRTSPGGRRRTRDQSPGTRGSPPPRHEPPDRAVAGRRPGALINRWHSQTSG